MTTEFEMISNEQKNRNFKPVTNKNSKTADFRHLCQTVVTGVTLGVRFCSIALRARRMGSYRKTCHYLSHLSLIEVAV